MSIDVSIIIINYNTFDLLLNCLNSIYSKTTKITYEIIVVDNNSPNREIENLLEIFPNVKLMLSRNNGGFGAGNNFGSTEAGGKYLFFLNSDTILLNNAIYELYKYSENNEKVGICGGNLYGRDLQPTISFELRKPGMLLYSINFIQEQISRVFFKRTSNFLYTEKPKIIRGYISGANFFIRKEIFEIVGKFDENFFMYFEEVDLTKRVNNHGLYSVVVPTAKIIHLEGGSQDKQSLQKIKWMKESSEYYFKKHNKIGYNIYNFEQCMIKTMISTFKKFKI